jgi:hypothetical protein
VPCSPKCSSTIAPRWTTEALSIMAAPALGADSASAAAIATNCVQRQSLIASSATRRRAYAGPAARGL